MGRRGPAATPANILQLTGNPGHRKANKKEARPRPTPPPPPSWLTASGKAAWKRLLPELDRLGLLTLVDGDAFAAYCEAVSQFEWATKTLAAEGMTFTTDKGYVGQHPAVAMRHKAMQLLKLFAAEFGLTPSARARLEVPAPDKDSGLGDLLD
jgi:P27 family predicted phage terminase small subunit